MTLALNNKLPGVILHGALKSAWLGQLLGDWVGPKGVIKKFGCSYRGMDVPGDTLTCRGKITKKYQEGEEHLVELEIWIEDDRGDKNTPGTAVVALPSKG
jgi:acyl dehydratase